MLSTEALVDSAAAQAVEDILAESTKNGGRPWFTIVKARMLQLLKDYEFVKTKPGHQASKLRRG